jgi:hypothetical protein
MLGFFKTQEQKNAELRAKFFALLKTGDFKRANDPRFKTVNLDGCCVHLGDASEGLVADELGNRTPPVKAADLVDLNDWSETKRNAFFQYRRLSIMPNHLPTLFPLSYFVHKGNIDAVSFLLNRGCDVNVGFQEPFQNRTRSFLQPIYYAVDCPDMIKCLLSRVVAPPDLGEFALVELNESFSSMRLAVIHILYDLDTNFKKNFQSLVDQRLSDNTYARGWLLKAMKLQNWRPVAPEEKKQDSKKSDKLVDVSSDFPQVTIKHVVDDVTVIDLYDFELRERITVTKSEKGVQTTRDSFSDLGRYHRGLKKAFNAFKEKGGKLNEEQLFSTGEITKTIYNPPASISTAAPG